MHDRQASQLGLVASAIMAVLAAAYLANLVVYFATHGFVFPPSVAVQLIAGVITLFTVPVMVVMFAAIKHVAGGNDSILGTLGLSFAILFAAVVSINRFVQLTVVRQAAPGADSADLARFLPYSTGSVMFALELLGWGVFIGLAALFVAPLFGGDRFQSGIKWTLMAFGSLSLVSAIGYVTQTPLTAVGLWPGARCLWCSPSCSRSTSGAQRPLTSEFGPVPWAPNREIERTASGRLRR